MCCMITINWSLIYFFTVALFCVVARCYSVLREPVSVYRWVSEWVEFNAPLDTIQVISEAELCIGTLYIWDNTYRRPLGTHPFSAATRSSVAAASVARTRSAVAPRIGKDFGRSTWNGTCHSAPHLSRLFAISARLVALLSNTVKQLGYTSGGSKKMWKGGENLSALSSFIANAHNEIHTFYTEKAAFWKKKYEPIGAGGAGGRPQRPFESAIALYHTTPLYYCQCRISPGREQMCFLESSNTSETVKLPATQLAGYRWMGEMETR